MTDPSDDGCGFAPSWRSTSRFRSAPPRRVPSVPSSCAPSDPDPVASGVDDVELPHPPGLIGDGAEDQPSSGQRVVEGVDIPGVQVHLAAITALRLRLGEVQLYPVALRYREVVTDTLHFEACGGPERLRGGQASVVSTGTARCTARFDTANQSTHPRQITTSGWQSIRTTDSTATFPPQQ